MKEISPFAAKVYAALQKVPEGKVTTYRELAKAVDTRAYQAIGQVMRCNPFAPSVPCHRVVKSDGTIGGFAGQIKGQKIEEKVALLKKEGVVVKDNKIEDFEKKKFCF